MNNSLISLSLSLEGNNKHIQAGRRTPTLWKLFETNWAALLSQRFPFFRFPFALGASVFIGAYLKEANF